MLTYTGRCCASAATQPSPAPRVPIFQSAASRCRHTGSPRHAARGTRPRSGRRPRTNRRYQAAGVSTSPAVTRTPSVGHARSRFSPSSSSTGVSRRSGGGGPHTSVPARTPPPSTARRARPLQPATRSTRALSPSALAPAGPSNAAARVRACSAPSSAARGVLESGRARRACASPNAVKYARPSASQARPSAESRASRACAAAMASGAVGGGAPPGAWLSAAASTLERKVAMLLRGIAVALRGERRQRLDEARPGVARIDDVVQIATRRREIGVGEFLAILALLRLRRVALVQHLHRSLRSHHRDLRRGPRHVVVAAHVLRVHDIVGSAVRLARDHGELGHGGLAVGVEQLRAVLDDATVLLRHAGQEPGHVFERDERDVERVAEADEPRPLERRVDVQHARQHRRLVRDEADRPAAQPREPDDQVLGEGLVHLEELPVVHDPPDHVVHVVGLGRAVRHDCEQLLVRRSGGPPVVRTGGSSRLLDGRYDSSVRIAARASSSESYAKCATPEVVACASAPPSWSNVTSSCVTVFTTLGPVTNMYEMPRTMKTKSVMAGL